MNIVFRCEASAQIGHGHFMRCLAIAQLLKDLQYQVYFCTQTSDENLLCRLSDEGIKYFTPIDLEKWTEPIETIFLDGYDFDLKDQKNLKDHCTRLVLIEDMVPKNLIADALINQNLGAEKLASLYPQNIELFLGIQYWMMRREFRQFVPKRKYSPQNCHHILLTLGGGDYTSLLELIIKQLNGLNIQGNLKILGPRSMQLKAQSSIFKIEYLGQCNQMAELIEWSDLVITGCGSTLWEVFKIGRPVLGVILAPNQEFLGQEIKKNHLALIVEKNNLEQLPSQFHQIYSDTKLRQEFVTNQNHFFQDAGLDEIKIKKIIGDLS